MSDSSDPMSTGSPSTGSPSTGTLPTGTPPTGTPPTGTLPTGTLPTGILSTGAVPTRGPSLGPEPIIRARGLSRRFVGGGETVEACVGIDLDVLPGEFVVVRGRSGAGKTTLLSLIAGLVRPSEGTVRVLGVDVETATEAELAELRRTALAMIPQEFGLLDALTAAENVEVPLRLDAWDVRSRDVAVAEALEAVGLQKHTRQRPSELSGGQQQRVAVARALVRPGRLLLADEPTGSLDSATASVITDVLHRLAGTEGTAVVVTTHDPVVVAKADRVLNMHDGRIAG